MDDVDALVGEHRVERLVRLRQAGLAARALRRGADDADDVDADPAQRLDVHDADEPRADHRRSHAPTLTASQTASARLESAPTATAPASRKSPAFSAVIPPVTSNRTSASGVRSDRM